MAIASNVFLLTSPTSQLGFRANEECRRGLTDGGAVDQTVVEVVAVVLIVTLARLSAAQLQ